MAGGSVNLGEANIRVNVTGANTARAQIDSLGSAVQTLGVKLFSARAIVNAFASTLRGMIGPVAIVSLAFQGLMSTLDRITGRTNEAAEAMRNYEEALRSLRASAQAARESDYDAVTRAMLKAERDFAAGVRELEARGITSLSDARYTELVGAYREAEAEIRAAHRRRIEDQRVAERMAAAERSQRARREAMDERERLLDEFEEVARDLRNRIDDATDESLRIALRRQLDDEAELLRHRLRNIDLRKAEEIAAAREAAEARERAEREAAERAAAAFAQAQAEAITRVGEAQRAEMARLFREQAVALERVVEVIERMAAGMRR